MSENSLWENKKESILKNVKEILDNADRSQRVRIKIDVEVGALPQIDYTIEGVRYVSKEVKNDVESDK